MNARRTGRLGSRIAFALCLALGPAAAPLAQVSPRELRDAFRDLDLATRTADTPLFLRAMNTALEDHSTRALRQIVAAFGEIVDGKVPLDPEEYFVFHSQVARRLAGIDSARLVAELRKLQERSRRWPSRLILLDVASLQPDLDLEEIALGALEDSDPRVIRRSLHFLRNTRRLPVVDAILDRFGELDPPTAATRGSEWDRTRLAFRSALTRILKVDLPAAADYANYLAARRDDPDLFEPREGRADDRTRLTLFGAEVSGKNIVFVLDVSGSMMSTDPIPVPTRRERGRTVVGDPARNPEIINERRRITRAKRELVKVVRNLPEDVRFNVIPYSSEVGYWRDHLALARPEAKDNAIELVNGLVAEGVTLTDEALEQAFADPAVDTVYLITDGAPTHIGSRGPERPTDADAIIRSIHRRMERLNFLRGVRIFTLGFPEAEEDFLKKLAGDHAGTYTPIR